jgi:hypothetical protein
MLQVCLSSLGWAMWGIVAGVLCDKASWRSLRFLATAAGTLGFLRGSLIPSLLCTSTFIVGSRLRVVGLTGSIAVGKSSV